MFENMDLEIEPNLPKSVKYRNTIRFELLLVYGYMMWLLPFTTTTYDCGARTLSQLTWQSYMQAGSKDNLFCFFPSKPSLN